MSKDVRDELDRLRAQMRDQLRQAEEVMAEMRRLEEAIAEVLKQTDPDGPKAAGKAKRHR